MHPKTVGRALAVLLLLCGSGVAQAVQIRGDCEVGSDYDFALSERSAIFTRQSGTPHRIVMRQGRLFVDDRWVVLGRGDRERVAEYERQARELMPLARQVGRDAAQVVVLVLGEVAASLSNDPDRTQQALERMRQRLEAQLERSVTRNRYRSGELGLAVGAAVREALPVVVGDIAGGAVRAALAGDVSTLSRLENLDAAVDGAVQPHADVLERNLRTLCERMRALDRIDDAIEYRLDGGRRLELLTVRDRD